MIAVLKEHLSKTTEKLSGLKIHLAQSLFPRMYIYVILHQNKNLSI